MIIHDKFSFVKRTQKGTFIILKKLTIKNLLRISKTNVYKKTYHWYISTLLNYVVDNHSHCLTTLTILTH